MSWFLNLADNILPTDNWDFYFCRVDDQPASIFVDLGRVRSAPIKTREIFAYLRLYMRKPRHDGLSSEAEFETLKRLEDEVELICRKRAKAVYVGRNTTAGFRDFCFYVAKLGPFENAVRVAMKNFPDYEFDVGGRPDPSWSVYLDFLYPNASARQHMWNRRVVERLKEVGDDLDLDRDIDHRVYFATEEQKMAFEKRVVELGFRLSNDGIVEPLASDFSKAGKPNNVDEIVEEVMNIAEAFAGEYDGWGCVAAGAPPSG